MITCMASAMRAVATPRAPAASGARSHRSATMVRAVISIAAFIVLWERRLAPQAALDRRGAAADRGARRPGCRCSATRATGTAGTRARSACCPASSRRCSSAFPSASRWRRAASFHDITFPVFEMLRPIPPLAWVPAAIIFWPTQELSITFIIFLGAFFTIVINVIGGARSIDIRLLPGGALDGLDATGTSSAASSCPACCPRSSSAGGRHGHHLEGGGRGRDDLGRRRRDQSSAGGGLGFFIWNSYVGGSYPQIVVGMIASASPATSRARSSAGSGCCVTPWLRVR